MKQRPFGKLNITASAFGVGCMRFPTIQKDGVNVVDQDLADEIVHTAIENGVTYFDTAYIYSDGHAEEVLGHALAGGWRERVNIATKLPVWNCKTPEDMPRLFEEELKALGTDHIDFYLIHSLNAEQWPRMRDLGVREFLDSLKASGKIRYACFSYHGDYDSFAAILNDYDWDMCQLQFNYLDENDQAGIRGLDLAASKGIPVVVMEGLLGGKLSNVPEEVEQVFADYPVKRSPTEWAFRWICNHPQVATVLSGVTNVEQLLDDCAIFDRVETDVMTEDEMALIDRARKAFFSRTKINCSGCRYCMPCPQGVDIPGVFSTWNYSYRLQDLGGAKFNYGNMKKEGRGADLCIECGACEAICPQQLPIIEKLKEANQDLS